MAAVMIDDAEGLDHLDAILSVKGIDMVLEDAVDLSQSFGAPGQPHHRRVQTAIGRMASACTVHKIEFCAVVHAANQSEH